MDAFHYIYKLKLQLEAIRKEYEHLTNHIQVFLFLPPPPPKKRKEKKNIQTFAWVFVHFEIYKLLILWPWNHFLFFQQEVKVEKFGTKFLVRVTCKKGKDLLVSIIEAFEKLNLNVFQAKATCKHFFFMEAVVEDEHQVLEVKEVTEAVVMAIQE